MIELYSGTPGSGKSLHATADIREALYRRYPRPVIANYPLRADIRNADSFHYWTNAEITPQRLVRFAEDYWNAEGGRVVEDRILLVLDEVQLLHNSREWQTVTNGVSRMQWIEFYSQHRKFGYRVILVAQFDRMIDRQIRALIEYECVHRSLHNFGIMGRLFSLLGGGRVFGCVRKYYPLNERVGFSVFVPHRRVYGMYDTFAGFRRVETAPSG